MLTTFSSWLNWRKLLEAGLRVPGFTSSASASSSASTFPTHSDRDWIGTDENTHRQPVSIDDGRNGGHQFTFSTTPTTLPDYSLRQYSLR